jgi:hypothetical protein
MLKNAELCDFVLAPRLKKKIPMILGSQYATLGANASAFLIS